MIEGVATISTVAPVESRGSSVKTSLSSVTMTALAAPSAIEVGGTTYSGWELPAVGKWRGC